jgi:hypothetical protein
LIFERKLQVMHPGAHHPENFFFFPVPVCAITASGVPGGTFVSMNRFSTL